jgi:hypothetical protein
MAAAAAAVFSEILVSVYQSHISEDRHLNMFE